VAGCRVRGNGLLVSVKVRGISLLVEGLLSSECGLCCMVLKAIVCRRVGKEMATDKWRR
jgi:hypothetical protein